MRKLFLLALACVVGLSAIGAAGAATATNDKPDQKHDKIGHGHGAKEGAYGPSRAWPRCSYRIHKHRYHSRHLDTYGPRWWHSRGHKHHGLRCPLAITKAAVAPDGTTAGAATDFVVTFVNPNPKIDGLALKTGATVEIVLAPEFEKVSDEGNSVALLQGWPQSPPAPPPMFPWKDSFDGNTITTTLTGDYGPGELGPGPKQAHVILLGYRNPTKAGCYPIKLTITPDPESKKTITRWGKVHIIPTSRPSINTMSLFSGPPGPPPPFFNPIYQTIPKGESAHQVGFYLWDAGNAPFLGVDIVMHSRSYGSLVQNKRTVGHVRIKAPYSATSFSLTTLDAIVAADTPEGPSELDTAFLTGVPVGKLLTQFTPDPNVTGRYKLVFRLRDGNTQKLFVKVVEPEKPKAEEPVKK